MKIAVVTDSTAYLTPQEAAENQITVVPIPLVIDGQSYQEGVDITTEEFYDKLAHSKSFPSTSQPSIGLLMETYQKLADEGYDAVISIHLTKQSQACSTRLRRLPKTCRIRSRSSRLTRT